MQRSHEDLQRVVDQLRANGDAPLRSVADHSRVDGVPHLWEQIRDLREALRWALSDPAGAVENTHPVVNGRLPDHLRALLSSPEGQLELADMLIDLEDAVAAQREPRAAHQALRRVRGESVAQYHAVLVDLLPQLVADRVAFDTAWRSATMVPGQHEPLVMMFYDSQLSPGFDDLDSAPPTMDLCSEMERRRVDAFRDVLLDESEDGPMVG